MKIPAVLTAGWVCLGLAMELAAQGDTGQSSFTDLDIEFTETQLNLRTAADENRALKRGLEESRQAVKTLTESLAVANSEAELFRRETAELKLRLEALGLESATDDRAGLEQRLLKAVRDLQLVTEEKQKLSEQLVKLSEALIRFLKGVESSDPEARMALEAELRSAGQALGLVPANVHEATPVASSLTDAMVISYKEDFQLIVVNAGEKQGMKIGMPLEIWRESSLVGRALVVDVRDKISGAVIQDTSSMKEKVKVGDRLRVETR
jgi:chromosome segregation ATPase